MKLNSTQTNNFGLMLILALIWGSSFILMKKGIEVFTANEVAMLRLGIAWITLLPFTWKSIKNVPKKAWKPLIAVGLFGNGIPAFLFTEAQTELDSSLIGILNALVPLFTFVLAIFIFKTKWKTTNLVGILIGLSGAVWLIAGGGLVLDNAHYAWLIVIATLCYSISLNTIKVYLQEMSSIQISALAFLFVGPPCIIGLIFSDFYPTLITNNESWLALGYITILAIIGTSLALVLFNKLVKNSTAIFASSVTYLIPIVAIFWGIMDGEQISINHFFGVAIILTGIYLVNKK
jgi:drug/metabolite transporter (DMT)-like permease